MSRKAIISTLVVLFVLVLGGIIVWRTLGPRETSEIRIGAILPLTGSAAQWGTPPRDAALLAVEEINSKGGIKGRKIKLEIEDDKCEPTAGVSAIQKILATGKPVAILGAVCSSVTLAIAPIAESNKVVLISPASTSPLITNAGDYIFRVIPSDALRGKVFAEYVYSLGHRKVSLLYINNEGGLGNQKVFSETFQKLGGNIVSVDAYPQDTRDVRAQLTKIKQQKPDALVVVSYPDDTPIVMRQAQELKIGVPLFFQTEALDDPAVIQKAGNAAEGATYILPAKAEGSAVDAFSIKYKQKYGRDPELFAAEGYDVVVLVAKILDNAPEVSTDLLKEGLYKTQNYEGASGKISFDKNGDVLKPMALKKVVNGIPQVLLVK
ncbi:MAG: ABC transporter substrate-binding protein [Deltaproteobacteria bacterium]|nr:ABC transporter substrate-binding protein [Deltaproteobacteria bacterium]